MGTDNALYEYGVDSLSALEIKNWCGEALGADIRVLELLSPENLGDLSALVATKRSLEAGRMSREIFVFCCALLRL